MICTQLHVTAQGKKHLRMLMSPEEVGGANSPSAFRRNFFPVYGLQRPGAYIYFLLELLFGLFYSRQGRDPELPNLVLELQLHLLLAAELLSIFDHLRWSFLQGRKTYAVAQAMMLMELHRFFKASTMNRYYCKRAYGDLP